MPAARITHTWADGDSCRLSIEVDAAYPDALDEARMQVTRMYADIFGELRKDAE